MIYNIVLEQEKTARVGGFSVMGLLGGECFACVFDRCYLGAVYLVFEAEINELITAEIITAV